MDVAEHFRTILRGWWRTIPLALVIAGLVYAVSNRRHPQYVGAAIVQVVTGASQTGKGSPEQTALVTDGYTALAKSTSVLADAIKRANLDITPETARSRIDTVEVNALGMILVKATGPTSLNAIGLAQGDVDALVAAVRTQQQRASVQDVTRLLADEERVRAQYNALPANSPDRPLLSAQIQADQGARAARAARPVNQVVVLTGAISNGQPISPRPARDAVFAFVLTFILASELWVLLSARADRFSTTDESEMMRELGLPVLARVPKGSPAETVEAIRTLRTNLMFLAGAGRPRTVAVVSASPGAGKTSVAVQVAESAAALDEQVVLIDADLRKPEVHERTGVDRAPGLTSVLQGADIATALRRSRSGSWLRVLPSGAPVSDPSGVLGARAFRQVLENLRSMRLVVVDTPPAELFADAIAIASQCDATVYVLDMKTSRKRAVRASIEALRRGGANIVGVVVNRAAAPRSSVEAAA
ncbi:MAG TPA: CpsD/CapB family tyrosine-protein kinase [Acidimicrobiia bacterium]